MIGVEYCANGDLLSYLQKRRALLHNLVTDGKIELDYRLVVKLNFPLLNNLIWICKCHYQEARGKLTMLLFLLFQFFIKRTLCKYSFICKLVHIGFIQMGFPNCKGIGVFGVKKGIQNIYIAGSVLFILEQHYLTSNSIRLIERASCLHLMFQTIGRSQDRLAALCS